MFKTKEWKKKRSTTTTLQNLSSLHHKRIEEFRQDESRVSALQARLHDLDADISLIDSKELKELEELRSLADLKSEREAVATQIARLSDASDQMDYYYQTSDILEKYSDLEEDPRRSKVVITDFFRDYTGPSSSPSAVSGITNRKELLDRYLEVIDPGYNPGKTEDDFSFCEACQEEMILKKDVGTYICTYCGTTSTVLVDGDVGKSSSQDSSNTKYSVYQRKNHFKEWLNQIQAKETTDIPEEVFDMIIVELNKMQVKNLADLNPVMIRSILKKLGLSKYYENTFHIIYRLNGLQPPTLSRDVEEQLLKYFKQIEEPFRLYKKKDRKNILRYSYILYKLCELMELDDFLRCFRLLKNRTKLIEQDAVWAAICKHLGWEFIRSV